MQTNLTADQTQQILDRLRGFLEQTKRRWDEENPGAGSWWHVSRTYIVKCTVFLISITDSLVQSVENLIPSGPEKKAAVLLVVANVFDYISVAAFPIWLRPFAPVIKEIIISIVISNLVDFIVRKYRDGIWKTEEIDGKTQKENDQASTLPA